MKQIFAQNYWIDVLSWTTFGMILFMIIPMLYPAELPLIYHVYHLVLFVVLIGVYYLNVGIIIPNVIKRGVNFYYVLLFIGLCILVLNLMNFMETQMDVRTQVYQNLYPNEEYRSEDHKSYIGYYLFFLTSIVLAVGYSNQIFKKWRKEEKKSKTIKAQKIKAELDSLKAQINPHFFFNTLNSIYALTYIDMEKSQKAILKLSKMMRYAMNEENKEVVRLSEETAFIQNYLELMHYRLPKNVRLNFELTQEQSDKEITPMVLLNFVENCFKHGISTEKECSIKISTAFENNFFVLTTENDWFCERETILSKGIGIENTRKRLDIIYENDYSLKQSVHKNRFYSILKIKLK